MIDRRVPADTQLTLEKYLVHSRRLLNIVTGLFHNGDNLYLEVARLSPHMSQEYRANLVTMFEAYKELLIDLRDTIILMGDDVTDISNLWVSDLEYYQNLMGEFQTKMDEMTGSHD